MKRSFLLLMMMSLLATASHAQEPRQVFIYDFEFKGVSPATPTDTSTPDASYFTNEFGGVLASEFQAVCYTHADLGVKPVTMVDMVSQLKKEQQKEIIQCKDSSCVTKIIENFGLSDTVFGMVTKVGDTFYIKVTWTRDEKVINTITASCAAKKDTLLGTIKGLPSKLFVPTESTKKSEQPVSSVKKETVKTTVASKKTETTPPVDKQQPPTVVKSKKGGSTFGKILVAGGLVMLAGSAICFVLGKVQWDKVNNATKDYNGNIDGITHKEAVSDIDSAKKFFYAGYGLAGGGALSLLITIFLPGGDGDNISAVPLDGGMYFSYQRTF